MAINFLNSVDFNKNELLNPTIENQPNDAGAETGVAGQLYFNTTDDILKVWTSSNSWVEVGGGVTSLTTTDGTYINLTPDSATTGAVTVTADLSAVDGVAGAGERYLTKNNTWATVASIPGTYAWSITADSGNQTINSGDDLEVLGGTYLTTGISAGPSLEISHDSTSRTDTTSTDAPGYGGTFEAVTSVSTNVQGHVTAIDVSTVTIPAAEDYTWTAAADAGGNRIILSGDTHDFAGGTNINTENIGGSSAGTVINLDDSITLAGTLTVNGTGQSSFAGQVTVPTTPSAATDAASKAYVDSVVEGGLIYQGGYNASTNTPDLTTSPNSILKGWTYTVTADGTFFGEQLRVGDVLIAEQDDPSALANWTTVQNNIDLASLTQVGIGNVNAATAANLDGLSVTYSSGTAIVGLDVEGLTQGTPASGNSDSYLPYYDDASTENKKLTFTQLVGEIAADVNAKTTASGQITAGSTSGTVTHNFGTLNTIVQTIDSNGDTVFCDISRTTNTAVATIAAAQAGDITILVQKIG